MYNLDKTKLIITKPPASIKKHTYWPFLVSAFPGILWSSEAKSESSCPGWWHCCPSTSRQSGQGTDWSSSGSDSAEENKMRWESDHFFFCVNHFLSKHDRINKLQQKLQMLFIINHQLSEMTVKWNVQLQNITWFGPDRNKQKNIYSTQMHNTWNIFEAPPQLNFRHRLTLLSFSRISKVPSFHRMVPYSWLVMRILTTPPLESLGNRVAMAYYPVSSLWKLELAIQQILSKERSCVKQGWRDGEGRFSPSHTVWFRGVCITK